jgi:Pyruvate/2-oxoacid:ferredoxin oxidoreductase delta subunit
MSYKMSTPKHCHFCNNKKGGLIIASPTINKRRVYICENCVEICMHTILTNRYKWKEIKP